MRNMLAFARALRSVFYLTYAPTHIYTVISNGYHIFCVARTTGKKTVDAARFVFGTTFRAVWHVVVVRGERS